MLKIRLQRIGRRNNPSYRVVVIDSATAAKKGKPVELLGTYDTIRKTTSLNSERILYWLSTGAQVSDTMHNILIKNGVIEGVKINTLPKKKPITKKKNEDEQEKATPATAQASDDANSADTESATEEKKDEEPKQENAKEKDADSNTDASEKKPQEPSSQNTPSAEG